jgi:thioredoxin-related protein
MKKVFLVLLIFAFVGATNSQTTKKAEAGLKWNSFSTGMSLAKKSGKKVLIDVYTDWCTWCKKMEATTYSDKKIQEYLNKNYVLIRLNPETDGPVTYNGAQYSAQEFSQGMGVNGYPATLFMKSDGQAITVLPGYSEAGTFIHVLNFIKDDLYLTKSFSDYLAEKGVKQ